MGLTKASGSTLGKCRNVISEYLEIVIQCVLEYFRHTAFYAFNMHQNPKYRYVVEPYFTGNLIVFLAYFRRLLSIKHTALILLGIGP